VGARTIASLLLAICFATGCRSPEPAFEEVPPAEELHQMGMEELEGTRILGLFTYVNYSRAIEIFQSIIDNYPYSDRAVEAELQIADAYFAEGKYEEALSYYRDFGELHPQHEKVAYTVYQSALCHQRQMKSANRDQTATRKAAVVLDQLLVNHPHSEYAREAEPLWRELQVQLAEHIEGIADFYMSREEYESAAERFRSLLNEYPGLGVDSRVLFKLARCYEALNRMDEADRIYRTIVAHYGESRYAHRARKRIAASFD
jgi:outer membrane protein assembly factor BamD